jgi:glycosidase
MAWTEEEHAGFSTVEPWLPLHDDWATRNAARQSADPSSMLGLHRRLLELRREEKALRTGTFRGLAATEAVLAYERAVDGRRLAILLNMTDAPAEVTLPAIYEGAEILLSASDDPPGTIGAQPTLAPNQGLIVRPRND